MYMAGIFAARKYYKHYWLQIVLFIVTHEQVVIKNIISGSFCFFTFAE